MSSSEKDESVSVRRIDGRLLSVRELKDASGKIIGTVTKQLKVEFKMDDVFQLVVGALVMAIPIAYAEEVWVLGETLTAGRIFLVSAASVVTLAVFVWSLFYDRHIGEYKADFAKRVMVAYLVTLGIALGVLLLIDKAPIDDLSLVMRRAVLVAFPAAFAAAAVDYIK